MPQTDVLALVPRIRRAVEGAGAPQGLADDALRDLAADAIAAVILYTGTVFGKELLVTGRDANGAPQEYATSDELTLPEQRVIAAQAALDYFFFRFQGVKMSERIADESSSWEYTLSATLLRDQLKLLVDERNKALDALDATGQLDSYTSFLQVRDSFTSALIEPWVDGSVPSGQVDYRFDVYEDYSTFGNYG